MPQEALPPSLAALLERDDFASTIFESGRCAHSVFESGRCAHSVGAASEWWTASSLALDSLLAALDEDSTVSPRGGASGFLHENHSYGHPARVASYRQGLDFQLGRVNGQGKSEQFDSWKYQYENLPNSETARRALEDGYSLTVRHAEWRIPCVFAAAVALQRATGAPVQANIYVTPPNERCVKPHADRHDVYAWQVSGAKTWLVREANGPPPPVPPRENKRNGGCDLPGAAPYPVERAVELRAGDTLYVPRGVPHQCRASGTAPSIHVSFGSDVHIPLTWEGALHCALRRRQASARTHVELHLVAMSTCPRLRRSCPPAVLRGDGDEALAAAADDMSTLAAAAADAVLWRAGLPGRAADWLSRPTNCVLDFVPLARADGTWGCRTTRGLAFLEDDRLGTVETYGHSAVGPVLVALRELTAPATRDVRVTALLDVSMMARAAREEVRRRGAAIGGVVGESV